MYMHAIETDLFVYSFSALFIMYNWNNIAKDYVLTNKKQTVQQRQEATIGDQIASLQTLREGLTAKKQMVEKQIRDLDARIQEKKEKGLGSVDK